jgi:nitroimidazol reductase NimA-like FMN-containing flavoprotein (pyridoxamine 5'-phosphate oxidase superfamily)
MTETEPVATEPLLAGAAPTPWSEVRQLLAKGDTYWLATVGPGGPPHVRPVLAVWLDGRLHFCASPSSRKGKNLALESQCVLATGADTADLVVEGLATRVDDQARLQRVAEAYAAKYEWHVEVRDGAFTATGHRPPVHRHMRSMR